MRTEEEYEQLESDVKYYKSLYASESSAKALIMKDGFAAFGNNGLLESWEHQAAALRAENAELREALESMLYLFDRELPDGSIGRIRCDEARVVLEKFAK